MRKKSLRQLGRFWGRSCPSGEDVLFGSELPHLNTTQHRLPARNLLDIPLARFNPRDELARKAL